MEVMGRQQEVRAAPIFEQTFCAGMMLRNEPSGQGSALHPRRWDRVAGASIGVTGLSADMIRSTCGSHCEESCLRRV
jgi:hypothetical protein